MARFKKGSRAAKAYMARLRAMQGKSRRTSRRSYSSRGAIMAKRRTTRTRYRTRLKRVYRRPKASLKPKHFAVGMTAAVPTEVAVEALRARYLSKYGTVGKAVVDGVMSAGGMYGYLRAKNPYMKGYSLAVSALGLRNLVSMGVQLLLNKSFTVSSNGNGGLVIG